MREFAHYAELGIVATLDAGDCDAVYTCAFGQLLLCQEPRLANAL